MPWPKRPPHHLKLTKAAQLVAGIAAVAELQPQ